MATVQDYATSFSYGAQDGTYYYVPSSSRPKGPNWVGNYHRGNDHPAPVGTALVVGGVTIGYSGNTGIVSGPHCHIQAGSDIGCQKDINPTPLEFQPGTIVNKGTAGQWGNYITVQVGNKFVTYCHLSSFNCYVGQYVGPSRASLQTQGDTTDMIDHDTLIRIYQGMLGRDPDQGAYDHYISKYTTSFVVTDIFNSQEHRDYVNRLQQNAESRNQLGSLQQTIDQLNQAVTSLTQQKLDDEKIIAQLQANPTSISLSPVSTNITQPNVETVNTTTSDTPVKVKKQTTSLFVRILSAWLDRKAKK